MSLSDVNSVYFLGVGGIGMSALARYLKAQGCEVSGYDKTRTVLTETLENEGIAVNYSEEIELIPEADLFVYTPAIPKEHPAFEHVRGSGKSWFKRSEVLQMITSDKPTIAVAGTHGKTTTTALVAHILHSSQVRIAAFVGGIMTDYESNVIITENPDWVVVEADEFDRSFHRLKPDIGIVTSIDPDHLDVYGSIEQVEKDFQQFATNCDRLIAHDSLKGRLTHNNMMLYGEASESEHRLNWQQPKDGNAAFKLNDVDFESRLPGKHNALNTCAAVAACSIANVSVDEASNAMGSFHGIQRRFETKLRSSSRVLIDDYAHHPKELEAVISATKELYPGKKIAVIFQPHLYSRTRDFEEGFVESLSMVDEVILLPIYPARELPIQGVSSANLLKKLPLKTKALVEKTHLVKAVLSLTAEIVLMLGAGDIDQLVEPVATALAQE